MEEMRMGPQVWLGILKGRAHLKIWLQSKVDLGAAQSGDVHWIYLAQVGSRGWPCEQGSEPSGSIKEMEFLG